MMNGYANGRGGGAAAMEFEASPYHSPEFANEWEMPEANSLEFEDEWETPASPYANPEFENEWQAQEAGHYASPASAEWEDEGEYFFKKALSGIRRIAKAAAPLAKRLAPIAAKTLVGAIPGVRPDAAPLAGKLVSALLREGEMEAVQMEAQFFGTNEFEAEVGNTETAQEAALTEVLAAEASHTQTEGEAEALLGAAVPSAVRSMGGQRRLRHVMPALVRANARLIRLLHQKGPGGRHLLRLTPTILRRTIASLKAAQQAGRPVNAALATRLMAAHAGRVLGNSKVLTKSMIRNAIIRQRTVAPGRSIA